MSEKINTALRAWLRRNLPHQSMVATVKSVDENNFTCAVDPVDGGATTYGVRLKPAIDQDASGFIPIPEVGSDVIVSITHNNENTAYVTVCGKVKKYLIKTSNGARQEWNDDGTIDLNGNDWGGLTKTRELQTQLNKTNLLLNALITVIKSAPIPEPGSGSPSAFQSVLMAAIGTLQLGDYGQIENTKVKHGKGV